MWVTDVAKNTHSTMRITLCKCALSKVPHSCCTERVAQQQQRHTPSSLPRARSQRRIHHYMRTMRLCCPGRKGGNARSVAVCGGCGQWGRGATVPVPLCPAVPRWARQRPRLGATHDGERTSATLTMRWRDTPPPLPARTCTRR